MLKHLHSERFKLSEVQSRQLRESESRALALHGRLRVLRDGNVEVEDEWSAGALDSLVSHLRVALPEKLITHVESRSGMEWSVFTGHCLSWWESARTPQLMRGGHAQDYHPFFLTLVERLATLDIYLEGFQWNQHRQVSVLWDDPPWWPLIFGAILGLLVSQGSWWAPWPLMLCIGVMFGWIGRSFIGKRPYCGGAACGSSLSFSDERCARCGGRLAKS